MFSLAVPAQVGINTDGSDPDASAILDVKSTEQGVLIPRMRQDERDAISHPATGLIIYQRDNDPGFYYYDGTAWVRINSSAPAAIKIDDLLDGKSDSDGSQDGSSVFLGMEAGANDDETDNQNVALGYQAAKANVSAKGNVAVGYKALKSNTAAQNTGLGHRSLTNTTTGGANTAVGYSSLSSNTEGAHNTAMGLRALAHNTTGNDNTAVGSEALFNNTTGKNNTAYGRKTMRQNTTGYENAAMGRMALYENTTGYYNTAVGHRALNANTTGKKNTAIGHYAFKDGTDYEKSTAIGYETAISASYQIRLGTTDITSIGGYADWTNLSDGRFKRDVTENVPGVALVMKLRPVTYRLDVRGLNKALHIPTDKDDEAGIRAKEAERQIGFIAQEVEQAARELHFDFHAVDKPKNDHDFYGLRYAEFVPVLVKAVQEQQNLIRAQQAEIRQLQQQFRQLQATLNSLKARLETNE